ncbi:hypothetical protein D9758_016496 [Tetrapyrgos nigripes]|uniref:Uncharacterized protein n=1 Tax=Tetrapyrgos nigripes TaxID=182062 RepID=A0A8H5CKA4_9AGAR|nr:hypothetical protein D9758_016496 [Tetrapyrgos nigripes]
MACIVGIESGWKLAKRFSRCLRDAWKRDQRHLVSDQHYRRFTVVWHPFPSIPALPTRRRAQLNTHCKSELWGLREIFWGALGVGWTISPVPGFGSKRRRRTLRARWWKVLWRWMRTVTACGECGFGFRIWVLRVGLRIRNGAGAVIGIGGLEEASLNELTSAPSDLYPYSLPLGYQIPSCGTWWEFWWVIDYTITSLKTTAVRTVNGDGSVYIGT